MKVFSRPGKRDNWSRQSFALLTLGLVLMPINKKSMISLNENHIIDTTGQSCGNKNVPFSQINISILADFGCFFGGEKTDFRP